MITKVGRRGQQPRSDIQQAGEITGLIKRQCWRERGRLNRKGQLLPLLLPTLASVPITLTAKSKVLSLCSASAPHVASSSSLPVPLVLCRPPCPLSPRHTSFTSNSHNHVPGALLGASHSCAWGWKKQKAGLEEDEATCGRS